MNTFKSTTFAVFIIAAVKAFEHPAPCVIKKSGQRNELIKTVLPKLTSFPNSFDWGDVDGVNYLTNIRQ